MDDPRHPNEGGRVAHIVPLAPAALRNSRCADHLDCRLCLRCAHGSQRGDGASRAEPMLMKGIGAPSKPLHGLRSSFSGWAADDARRFPAEEVRGAGPSGSQSPARSRPHTDAARSWKSARRLDGRVGLMKRNAAPEFLPTNLREIVKSLPTPRSKRHSELLPTSSSRVAQRIAGTPVERVGCDNPSSSARLGKCQNESWSTIEGSRRHRPARTTINCA